jgi:tRNA modification GTPase
MWSVDDLIIAPATAAAGGARAIVRIAGSGLADLLGRLFDVEAPGLVPPGGRPRLVTARLAASGLGSRWGGVPVEILHWPGPTGPVGGPLAEVQLPGSVPLVADLVAAACGHGARLARGGEFTLRGFLAGRLDLVQAEAVLAVVDARTPDELAAALDRMAGGAGEKLRGVRDVLLDLLADVEAAVDFADETTPDAVPVADEAAWRSMRSRLAAAADLLAATAQGLARRDAAAAAGLPRAVLVGRPNVGKSSLFNALVGRGAAVVADQAGTTRDWLEAPLAGAACTLVDLAGIAAADPADQVDAAAVAAARAEVDRADVVVVCRDALDPVDPGPLTLPASAAVIDVVTRCDRGPPTVRLPATAIRTSSRTAAGLDELRAAIDAALAGLPTRGSPATVRMAVGVAAAREAVAAAGRAAEPSGPDRDEAVVAVHLRSAVDALAEVTGATIGTDLLDRIFSRHCIGK